MTTPVDQVGVARLVSPHTVAWAVLWFLVVVTFTAGVGIIQAAGAAGEMPPLTSSVDAVVGGNDAGDPSSAPLPGAVRAG